MSDIAQHDYKKSIVVVQCRAPEFSFFVQIAFKTTRSSFSPQMEATNTKRGWILWPAFSAGLPDFSCYNIPKRKNIPNNQKIGIPNGWKICIPNGHKIGIPNIYKICIPNGHLPLQDPPKFTKISIFGLEICHLATLIFLTQETHRTKISLGLSLFAHKSLLLISTFLTSFFVHVSFIFFVSSFFFRSCFVCDRRILGGFSETWM
jgi:hypothetical protein